MNRTTVIPAVAILLLGASIIATTQIGRETSKVNKAASTPKAEPKTKSRKLERAWGKLEFDKASYEKWAEANRPSEEARKQAEVQLERGDLDASEQLARQALVTATGLNAELARKVLAEIHMRRGQYAEAVEVLRADYMPGKNAWYELDLALCYTRLGQVARAKQFFAYDKLVAYGSFLFDGADLPGIDTRVDLEGSILLARGIECGSNYRGALRELREAAELAPRNAVIAYFAAKALYGLGRHQEAEPYFQVQARYGRGDIKDESEGTLCVYEQHKKQYGRYP